MNMKAGNLLKELENSDEIGQDKVVRLRFRITDRSSGRLLQYGDDLIYLHGGYGGAFPKMEQAMQGCRIGDRVVATRGYSGALARLADFIERIGFIGVGNPVA